MEVLHVLPHTSLLGQKLSAQHSEQIVSESDLAHLFPWNSGNLLLKVCREVVRRKGAATSG